MFAHYCIFAELQSHSQNNACEKTEGMWLYRTKRGCHTTV